MIRRRIDYEAEFKRLWPKVDLERVLDYYSIDFREITGRNGPEYIMCCPFPDHDDTSPSFCFNIEHGIYNCFVCGGGNFFKFIQIMEDLKTIADAIDLIKNQLGITDEPTSDFDYIDAGFKSLALDEKTQEIPKQELKEIVLPKTDPAEDHFEIVSKRVTLEDIKKWGMRYCVNDPRYKGKYDGRLIIPIYFKGKLVSFAARDMLGKADKWKRMLQTAKEEGLSKKDIRKLREKHEVKKVLYPFGSPNNFIFFNWDGAVENDYVILTEGVFDAIRLVDYGYNAMALLSCHLSQYRANLLMRNFKTIYIALDNDNKEDKQTEKEKNPGQYHARQIIQERLNGHEVYNILLSIGKDPDDCTKTEFDGCFHAAKNFFEVW